MTKVHPFLVKAFFFVHLFLDFFGGCALVLYGRGSFFAMSLGLMMLTIVFGIVMYVMSWDKIKKLTNVR